MSEQELKKVIDNGSRVIIEMTSELEKMKTKYGTDSKFVKLRAFHVECLIELHEECVNEINALRNALKMATIVNKAQELAQDALVDSFVSNIHTDQMFLLKPNNN